MTKANYPGSYQALAHALLGSNKKASLIEHQVQAVKLLCEGRWLWLPIYCVPVAAENELEAILLYLPGHR